MRPITTITPALVVVLCGGVLGSGGCSGGREEAGLCGAGGAGGAHGMGVGMGIPAPHQCDVLGNLRSVTLPSGKTIEHVIDGLGRRVGRKVDGQLAGGLLYRDALRLIAALGPDGSTVEAVFAYGARSAPEGPRVPQARRAEPRSRQ